MLSDCFDGLNLGTLVSVEQTDNSNHRCVLSGVRNTSVHSPPSSLYPSHLSIFPTFTVVTLSALLSPALTRRCELALLYNMHNIFSTYKITHTDMYTNTEKYSYIICPPMPNVPYVEVRKTWDTHAHRHLLCTSARVRHSPGVSVVDGWLAA